MKLELFKYAPEGTFPMISGSGFINSELFVDWLKQFKYYVKPNEDDPVLLIRDNHTSHCSLEPVTFCREHCITLLSLPQHSSRKTEDSLGRLKRCALLKLTNGCTTTLCLQFHRVIFV
jgi:hypothetical protein